MSRIENLTDAQKARFDEFIDKWMAIGLSTKKADRVMAENGIEEAYKIAGLKKPKVVWTLSPLSSGITRYTVFEIIKHDVPSVRDSVWASVGASVGDSVRASVGDSVWDSIWSSVRDSVWASVGASVRDSVGYSVRDSVEASVRDSVEASVRDSIWSSVRDSVWASVGASVRDSVWSSVRDSVEASVGASVRDSVGSSVRDSVRDSIWDSVRSSVWASVGASVRDSVWSSVRDSIWDSAYGSHDSHWLGFYDYLNDVVKLEAHTEKLKGLWMIAQSANWFLPHENICWISERHNICKLKEGRIHADGGPAIQYPDGFSIWALNGVRVPQSIAETPAEKIDANIILKEQNAEVRREIVRKIGIERVCKKLNAKCIDKSNDGVYELLILDLGDGRKRPYLKMLNPSIRCYHIEGVSPGITTIDGALIWRNGTKEKPAILT
jgi:hypothetical protein